MIATLEKLTIANEAAIASSATTCEQEPGSSKMPFTATGVGGNHASSKDQQGLGVEKTPKLAYSSDQEVVLKILKLGLHWFLLTDACLVNVYLAAWKSEVFYPVKCSQESLLQ